MKRLSNKIITNAYQGAFIKKMKINNEISYLSKKVSKLFNLDMEELILNFLKMNTMY